MRLSRRLTSRPRRTVRKRRVTAWLPSFITALITALKTAPRSEEALRAIADFTDASEHPDQALSFYTRLCAEYPQTPTYHYELARQYARRKDWPRVFQTGREALHLNPFLAEARAALAVAHEETGERRRAEAEWRLVGVLDPQLRKALGPR